MRAHQYSSNSGFEEVGCVVKLCHSETRQLVAQTALATMNAVKQAGQQQKHPRSENLDVAADSLPPRSALVNFGRPSCCLLTTESRPW